MRPWTIRGWLRGWLVLTTVGLILVIAVLSGVFLRASVNRELNSLAHEEVDEMLTLFSVTDGSRAAFDGIHAQLSASHPANPLAWRVWDAQAALWHEVGDPELLHAANPQITPREVTRHVGRGLRWRAEALQDGRVVAVVVDGSAQFTLLKRYGLFSLALLLGALVIAWAVASFLSGRTSALLRAVADGVRGGDQRGLNLTGAEQLPAEISAVADSLEQALQRIRSESERAHLMTAGLAHELRSPIQNLMGEAEVTLMSEREPAEYRRVLEAQIDELRDLGRVVDNLVLLCASDEPSSGFETFDLGDEATLRLDRDSLRATRRGVRLALECSGDLEVRGDREALVLALRNLVSNAVGWSPAGGRVDVSIAGQGGSIEVIVDDQGPGIPAELVERVFEPFQRGPQAASRRVGFGLGLALARTAVVMHGGQIFAERSPAGGARLRFTLPGSAAAGSRRVEDSSADRSPFQVRHRGAVTGL